MSKEAIPSFCLEFVYSTRANVSLDEILNCKSTSPHNTYSNQVTC